MAAAAAVNGGGGHQHRRPPPSFPASSSSKALAATPPRSRRPVCTFWLQGRCTRRPCPFLHLREAPSPSPAREPPKTQNHRKNVQQEHGGRPLAAPSRFVWRNPNLVVASAAACPIPGKEDIKKSTAADVGDAPTYFPAPPTAILPLGDGGIKKDGSTRDGDGPECPAPFLSPSRGNDREEASHDPHGSGEPAFPLAVVIPSPTAEDDDAKNNATSCGGETLECPPTSALLNRVGGDDGGGGNGTLPEGDDAQKDDTSCSGETPECPPTLAPLCRHGGDGGDGALQERDDAQKKKSTLSCSGGSPECPPTAAPLCCDGGDDGNGALPEGDNAQKKTTSCGEETLECPPTPAPLCCDCGDDGGGALPEGVSSVRFVTALGGGGSDGGHQEAVTGIVLPSGCDRLFSSSSDGTVRVWDCHSGRCVQMVELGGPVACLITDGHWVFAGARGAVRGCNTLTGTGVALPGPAGQVFSLATSSDMLFAGVEGGGLLAWRVTFDAAAGADGFCFRPAASLGGHTSAVVSLAVGGRRLYSGCIDGTVTAWDVDTLCCACTVSAHVGAVTSLLCWGDYLLSCSVDDGTVKVWAAAAKGGMEALHTRPEAHGIIGLHGGHDADGRPVVVCSLGDGTVRFYGDPPAFASRGSILCREVVRAVHSGPGGLFFTGDAGGEVRVWRWSEA